MAKKKRVEEPYVPYQPGDFAKGLMDFCKEFESQTSYYEEKYGSIIFRLKL